MTKRIVLFSLLIILLHCGCKPKATEESLYIELPKGETVMFDAGSATREVALKSNVRLLQVHVSPDAKSWLSAKLLSNAISVSVLANEKDGIREGKVTVSGSGISKELKVTQGGQEPFILLGKKLYETDEYGGKIMVETKSNRAISLSIPEEAQKWLELQETSTTEQTTNFTLHAAALLTGERKAQLTIATEDGTLTEKIEVVQRAGGEYKPKEDIKVVTDVQVKVARATASSEHSGEGIDKAIDGKMNTIYHSDWNNSGSSYFPITLEFFFDNADEIDYLIYYPRTEGYNGHFREIEVLAKEGNADYRSVVSKDLGGSGSPSKIVFDTPLKNVASVKIVVKSGHGDGQGFASAAEIQFFKNSEEKMEDQAELKKIFTDSSASEVRPEVTDAEIASMKNPALMQIAHHLRAGTYPRNYRIATYRAWAVSEEERARNHTSYNLSQFDNPTGIAVADKEKLLVLVGNTHGEKVSLTVVNFDKPGGDGYWQQSHYPLEKGANYLTMDRPGLVYVMYNVSHWQSAQPITVHIASGKVNGYYDSTKDSAADFVRKLNETSHPYFDVVGKRAHLVFPVSEYRAHTGSRGKELIDLYDWIVGEELDFLGVNKYDRGFNNRAFFHVMYSSYMYATTYRTAYIVGTCSTILNPDELRKQPWGTAHEQGHQLQTYGFKWKGMTEVTNNVMSLYIQTKLGNPARIQQESMKGDGGFINRYDKAHYYARIIQDPYIQIAGSPDKDGIKGRDVFCNLVSLWQLQLYMTHVEGNPDFYKDLYEELRKTNDARRGQDRRNQGEIQLDFTRIASKVAGLDLTEFFEKWGFFRPMDAEVDDYGKANFKITKELADSYRQKVAEMGLPKPTLMLDYICDDNVKYFKDRIKPSGSGTATRSGEFITIPDSYKGAVAYEYYVGEKLCGVGNNHLLKVKDDGTTGAKKLYGIAYDGSRLEIPLN